MTTYLHDVAISAVAYDRILVAEVTERLTSNLRVRPYWADGATEQTGLPSPLAEESSRLVLVLHQRLWGHEDVTRSDATIIAGRARCSPGSVVMVALDETSLPNWAAGLRSYSLAAMGVDGVAEAVLVAIAASGGTVRAAPHAAAVEAVHHSWDAPKEFLSQLRAYTALQRELDALSSELRPWFRTEEAQAGTHIVEFPARPHRLIARLDDVGVSFSWVPGQGGAVADGRLLVIEWGGLRQSDRGAEALKGATPVRERVYRPEAIDPERWRWRADEPNGRASTTANLVGEWLSGALMAWRGFETAQCSP
jgi:hypothetical protein